MNQTKRGRPMRNDRRRRVRRAGLTALCAAVTLFIFTNSLRTGAQSSLQSGRVLAWVLSLFPGAPADALHLIIRKAAHMTEFALLGLTTGCTVRAYTPRVWRHITVPLFVCLAVAVADEFLQRFIEGRGSSVADVVIDFGGALVGVLLAYGAIVWRDRRRRRDA